MAGAPRLVNLKKRRAYKDGLLLLSEFRTAGGVEALSRLTSTHRQACGAAFGQP